LADTLLTESRNEIARLTEANARLQSELAQLRTEAERTTATLAAAERRALVGALLAEFKLPPSDSIEPAARAITSHDFVQELLAASSNGDVRRLVEERAALVAGIRHNLAGTTNNALRPVSRAPRGGEPAQPSLNIGAFVRAIRG
ncbi:MAG: hypothetical protein K8T25_15670, partial [Planctomycetia bacterium]|nr:hypothetical protein [Planctomycetia bacterium]